MKNIKAFTLAEVVTVIALVGFLTFLTGKSLLNVMPELLKMKAKTANVSLKQALNNIISNPNYYGVGADLTDLNAVVADELTFSGETKFRELFINELGISAYDVVKCEMLRENYEIEKLNACYESDNGIVWAIPETDFIDKNMLEAKNGQGTVSKYLPITIYPDPAKIEREEHLEEHAMIIGVRRDGSTAIINTVDCESGNYDGFVQCRTIEYLSSVAAEYKKGH